MVNTQKLGMRLVAGSMAFATAQSLAAGFQLNAQSATGLGRAFAGDAVS